MQPLADIEAKMQALKAEGLTTKAKRTQYNQLKRTFAKTYASAKERVMAFEQHNQKYLVLLRSTNGFYKMFEHSALFYAEDLAPKMNLTATLQLDSDFSNKSEIGSISIHNLDKLTTPLKKLKITPAKTKDASGNYLLYQLPWEYSSEQIEKMIAAGELRLQRFNHLVMVDNAIPVLFLQLEELHRALFQNVRRMAGPVEREAYGLPTLAIMNELECRYLDFANGRLEAEDFFQGVQQQLDTIKYRVKIINDLKIWEVRVTARIGEILMKLVEIVESECKFRGVKLGS